MRGLTLAAGLLSAALLLTPGRADAQQVGPFGPHNTIWPNTFIPLNPSYPGPFGPTSRAAPNGSSYWPTSSVTQPSRFGMSTVNQSQFNPGLMYGGLMNGAVNGTTANAGQTTSPNLGAPAGYGALPAGTSTVSNPETAPAATPEPGAYGTANPAVTGSTYTMGAGAGIFNPNSYANPFDTAAPSTIRSPITSGYSPYNMGYPYGTGINLSGYNGTTGTSPFTTTNSYPSTFLSALRQVYPYQGY